MLLVAAYLNSESTFGFVMRFFPMFLYKGYVCRIRMSFFKTTERKKYQ